MHILVSLVSSLISLISLLPNPVRSILIFLQQSTVNTVCVLELSCTNAFKISLLFQMICQSNFFLTKIVPSRREILCLIVMIIHFFSISFTCKSDLKNWREWWIPRGIYILQTLFRRLEKRPLFLQCGRTALFTQQPVYLSYLWSLII